MILRVSLKSRSRNLKLDVPQLLNVRHTGNLYKKEFSFTGAMKIQAKNNMKWY